LSNALGQSSFAGSGSVAASANLSGQWQVAGTPDMDADGNADLLLHNAESGDVGVWLMSNGTLKSAALITSGSGNMKVPAPWRLAGSGDFDGDGKIDLLWGNGPTVDGQSNDVALWLMASTTSLRQGLMVSGATVLSNSNWQLSGAGDFNSDGKADLVWRKLLADGDTAHPAGSVAFWS
jgi:hypothetical protein